MTILKAIYESNDESWTITQEDSILDSVCFYFLDNGIPITRFEGLQFGVEIYRGEEFIFSSSTPSAQMISAGILLTTVNYIDNDFISQYIIPALNPGDNYTITTWYKISSVSDSTTFNFTK